LESLKLSTELIINCFLEVILAINNQSLANKHVGGCISSWIMRAPKVGSGYCSNKIYFDK